MPFEVNSLMNDPTMQSLKLAMDAAVMKQQAIASNIANVNTPGYKRLDLSPSFQTQLSNAMEKLQNGENISTKQLQPTLTEYTDGITRFDGNNVNMDRELQDLGSNQSKYEFAAKMLLQRYSILKMAIQQRSM